MSFWGGVGDWFDGKTITGALGSAASYLTGTGANDPANPQRSALNSFGQQAGQNYAADTAATNATQGYLQNQMQGGNSISALQLHQGLQQNLAAQQAQAASAAPQNAAMAARTAAMQSGMLGAGLSGQQAMAGIQERNAAAQSLGQLQLGLRGQDVQGITGAYGSTLANPQKSTGQAILGAVGGLAGAATKLGG